MAKKTISLPKKNLSPIKKNLIEKLSLKYPRLIRDMTSAELIDSSNRCFYPPFKDDLDILTFYNGVGDPAYYSWSILDLYLLWDSESLDHIAYKALKSIYGEPDFIAGLSSKGEQGEDGKIVKHLFPLEWGYLIKISPECYVDIFKRYRDPGVQIELYFSFDERPKKIPESVLPFIEDFKKTFFQLIDILDGEYIIEEESQKTKDGPLKTDLRSLINLYHYNIVAAKDMLDFASEMRPNIKRHEFQLNSEGKFDEALNAYRKSKIFYVSSIMYSITALESFLNVLYKLLLKEKYKHKVFNRIIHRGDIEVKLLHLSVYCEGFSANGISPKDIAYKNWIKLRPFRNNLMHGNISKEHEGVTVAEDIFTFNYMPMHHKKFREKHELHTDFLSIDKNDAEKVMRYVKEIIKDILSKLDKNKKDWVDGWIDELLITYTA